MMIVFKITECCEKKLSLWCQVCGVLFVKTLVDEVMKLRLVSSGSFLVGDKMAGWTGRTVNGGGGNLIHKNTVFHMLKKKRHLMVFIKSCSQWACVLPFPCRIVVPGWKTFYDIYLMTHTCWVDEKQLLLGMTYFKGAVSFWGLRQVILKSFEFILISPVEHI